MTLGTWQIFIYNKSDVFQAEIPFTSITITKELNKIAYTNVTVPYFILSDWTNRQGFTVDSLLTSGFKWASIKRNGVVVFNGILSEVYANGSGENIYMTLTFKNWLAYFQKRFITKTYSSTDAGDIAWDLINTAQGVTNGNLGVTQGSITATFDRDRTYVNDEIALAITRLSNNEIVNGFDFEITNDKVFNVASTLGQSKPEIVFDNINIIDWRINYTGGLSLTNNVIVLGNGIEEVRNTTGSEQSNWYLLTSKISYASVIIPATLQEHGDSFLDLNKDIRRLPEIKVVNINYDISDYGLGDTVKVKIADIIDGLYRINKEVINVNDENEHITIGFI